MSKNTPIIIKKYSNRRLYNTHTSDYITLDDLHKLIKNNVEFVVQDAKTGDDLTHFTLTQLVLDRELKGNVNILPINFLKQILVLYDDNLHKILSYYLESSMQTFVENQNHFRQYMNQYFTNTVESFFPLSLLETMTKNNLQIFTDSFQRFFLDKVGKNYDTK
ncbi:MAG: polyhydroxyalkanoate synthesis repressor PhaR [Rickettsiales endosymbiont of Dermacentor nuttalli]